MATHVWHQDNTDIDRAEQILNEATYFKGRPPQRGEEAMDGNPWYEEATDSKRKAVVIIDVIRWLVVWNMFYFSIIYGMSAFPLTNSYFSEG